MTAVNPPTSPRDPETIEDARAQALEYIGLAMEKSIKLSNGDVFVIPNPSNLGYEQQERYDEMMMENENLDCHPDVLNEDGSVKTKGQPLEPHRKGGKRVENFDARVTRALFGTEFDRFIKGGGRPSDVTLIWWEMNKRVADRQKSDPKSAVGAGDLAALPGADRGGSADLPAPADNGMAPGNDEQSRAAGADPLFIS